MTEWREYRLSDIMDIISGGTPKTSVPEYWSGNIPWLSVADFNNVNRYVYDTEKHISELGLKNSSTKILKKGQLIISARGTVGALAQLKRDMAFNQSCYGLNANSLTTNDFLFYLLKYCIAELKQQSSGGVFDTIIRETFDNISVFLPPLPEQKAIAEVLSSLDDKIDLLTRQNKTLEDLAQAYFRKWFIEDASDEWEVGKLGDEFNITMGQSPKGETYNDLKIGLPFFQGKAEFGFRFPLEKQYCSEPIKIADKFDTLLSVRAPVGALNMALYKCCIGRGLAIPIHKKGYKHYTFYKMKSLQELFNTFDDDGTVFGSISREKFLSIDNVIPPEKLVCYFDNFAKYFDLKIYENTVQIRTLSKLRDTLLPKLISGEVRVNI